MSSPSPKTARSASGGVLERLSPDGGDMSAAHDDCTSSQSLANRLDDVLYHEIRVG